MDIEFNKDKDYLDLFYNRDIFSRIEWRFNYDPYVFYTTELDAVQFIIDINSGFFPSSLVVKFGFHKDFVFSPRLILTKNYNNESNRSK